MQHARELAHLCKSQPKRQGLAPVFHADQNITEGRVHRGSVFRRGQGAANGEKNTAEGKIGGDPEASRNQTPNSGPDVTIQRFSRGLWASQGEHRCVAGSSNDNLQQPDVNGVQIGVRIKLALLKIAPNASDFNLGVGCPADQVGRENRVQTREDGVV